MITRLLRHFCRMLVIAVVAVGTISASTVSLADQAGAAATTVTHSRTATLKHKELARAVRRDCTRLWRWQHQQKRVRARFEKRLHRLKTWEATAIAVGHAPRVAALKRDIVHVRALRAQALMSRSAAKEGQGAKGLAPACTAVARAVQAERKTTKATKAKRVEARAKARASRLAKARAAAAAREAAKAAAAKAASSAKAAAGTRRPRAVRPRSRQPPRRRPRPRRPARHLPPHLPVRRSPRRRHPRRPPPRRRTTTPG